MTHIARWQITDTSIVNEHFVCIDFHTALDNATIQFNKICVSLFSSFQCCYHNDIATVATFNFLGQGGIGRLEKLAARFPQLANQKFGVSVHLHKLNKDLILLNLPL